MLNPQQLEQTRVLLRVVRGRLDSVARNAQRVFTFPADQFTNEIKALARIGESMRKTRNHLDAQRSTVAHGHITDQHRARSHELALDELVKETTKVLAVLTRLISQGGTGTFNTSTGRGVILPPPPSHSAAHESLGDGFDLAKELEKLITQCQQRQLLTTHTEMDGGIAEFRTAFRSADQSPLGQGDVLSHAFMALGIIFEALRMWGMRNGRV